MSKSPLLEKGNILIEKIVIQPNRDEDAIPHGFGLPVYATAPDPESNNPGTSIFNSTTDAVEVVRNDGTYAALAFSGDAPSGNVTLATYDTDAEAPSVNGSIYLNTDDYPGKVRVYNSGSFTSLASPATPLNFFAAPVGDIDISGYGLVNVQYADSTNLTQAVNVGYVSDNTLSSGSSLNTIAAINITTDNINMNNHRLTGLSNGVDVTDSVTMQQLTNATISRYGAISVTAPGTPQTFVTAGVAQAMGGTFVSSGSSTGISITDNTISNTSGATLMLKVSLDASISSLAGGSVARVNIAKNGTIVGFGGSASLDSAGKAYSLGYSDIITLANNDAVTPFLDTDTNGDILTVESAYFNVTKV